MICTRPAPAIGTAPGTRSLIALLVCLLTGSIAQEARASGSDSGVPAAEAATAGTSVTDVAATGAPATDRVVADVLSNEGWFDTVTLSAWPDDDGDGFASGLSITLDADTTGGDVEVYARLSLSGSDGVERLLYDTSRFRIRGRSTQDRLDVELDLIDAFPADRYDLVVELRTERRDRLLDVVDRGDFFTLGGIALEDAYRDGRHDHGTPVDDAPGHGGGHGHGNGYGYGFASDGHSSSSYVAVDYAGAGGPLGIALLGLIAACRWRSVYSVTRQTRSPRDESA